MKAGQPSRKQRKENEKAIDRVRREADRRRDADLVELGPKAADALAPDPAAVQNASSAATSAEVHPRRA